MGEEFVQYKYEMKIYCNSVVSSTLKSIMMNQKSFRLILALMIGATSAYPVRYSQPIYHQQYAPQNAPVSIQYHRAPVEYQAAPVEYNHSPVQYQYLQHPQYQSVPVAYAKVEPASHESAAHNHGAHGQNSAGHSISGLADYGSKAAHKESAATAQGHHNVGGYNTHGTHGDNHNSHGTYHNTGSYSEDKGNGYEKSYSYDRASGFHDIASEDTGTSNSYGSQTKEGHHNVGAHSSHEQEKKGAHSKTGSSEHSTQAHNKSLFGKYGYSNSGKQQGYSYSPVYGYGYH